ncbi:MAG: hypothetical protein HQL96_00175 [Magnetococcales bacterium]|nr:hypothetical protein [Magnetococcales bacterium]
MSGRLAGIVAGLLGGMLLWAIGPAWAHGPGGKPVRFDVEWCGEGAGRTLRIADVRAGGRYPVCLQARNEEPIDLQVNLSVGFGQIDAQGRRICRVPHVATREEAWLTDSGGAEETPAWTLPANATRSLEFFLHIDRLTDYPADASGGSSFRGWLGCLLVEGRAQASETGGHKGVRLMRMIQATDAG